MKSKKLTPLQQSALKDVLTHGELSRDSPSDEFRPGGHRGNIIRSLIDRGLMEATDLSRFGYPMRVKPTKTADWDIATA